MPKTIETQKTNDQDTNVAVTVKNFKNSTDVEAFYRFIHDNKLRSEAKDLIAYALKKITPPKRRGRKKSIDQ